MSSLKGKITALSDEIQFLCLSTYSKPQDDNLAKINTKQCELYGYNVVYTYLFEYQDALCDFGNFTALLTHIADNISELEKNKGIQLFSLSNTVNSLIETLQKKAMAENLLDGILDTLPFQDLNTSRK